jgi:hypothetical protein
MLMQFLQRRYAQYLKTTNTFKTCQEEFTIRVGMSFHTRGVRFDRQKIGIYPLSHPVQHLSIHRYGTDGPPPDPSMQDIIEEVFYGVFTARMSRFSLNALLDQTLELELRPLTSHEIIAHMAKPENAGST